MNKTNAKKTEVYIRSDGWVFTQDGLERLRAGGYKGFERFKKSVEAKLGKWHRVSKPLDRDAAAVVKSVKGLVERGMFISSAIVKEAERRSRGKALDGRSGEGESSPAEFMRLTLTADAYETVRKMSNSEFREFVSNAILQTRRH
jgi:hypothetical protein